MKKCIVNLAVVFALSLVITAVATNHDSHFVGDHPDTYTVKKDDTLWDISGRFLKQPWYWPEIWHVNNQIANPHLIFPGDVIKLVYIDGEKRLTVSARSLGPSSNIEKLKPQIYATPINEAIATIPLDEINAFLSKSRLLEEEELEIAPYVLAGDNQRLILGAGDKFYARGQFADDVAAYSIYRKDKVYADPETGETLGVQVMDIGSGNMQSIKGDIATLNVTRAIKEIRISDRLMPNEERSIESTFFPSPPANTIEGVIIGVEGGAVRAGMLDVVILNRGKREGLDVGNVLAVYKRGEVVEDKVAKDEVELPEVRAGLLMVFKLYNKLSLALVMKATQPLTANDIVRNP